MKIQNPFRLGLIGALGVGLGILILSAITSLATIITYIGAALFLALGIEPLISFLERRKFPRWLALVVSLVVIIGAFIGLIWAIVPVAISQATQLVQNTITWVNNGDAEKWFLSLQHQFPGIVNQQNIDAVTEWLQKNLPDITSKVLQTGVGIVQGVFGVVIVLILTIYFTASLPAIKRSAYQLVPASRRARFADLGDQITDSVGKYVMGQVLLALVNGILSAIFLTVIGAKFPILLASIAFFFSLIPLVGTITGSVIIVAVCFLSGTPTAIAAAIYYLIYMQVEAYVLSPRIMNRAVSVPGALVVVAALAGGTLLGILGALVAIPFAAAILLIVKQVVIPRQNEL
ncbi:Predicted PurR-regulated permease PerM [Leifsonia sp. 98AMF]|uniref:AI-2E family transporter n=1 Tax=unclassified Leifsonia TaxID=2663824 RepID=UPI00087BBA72|nr:MULTISPECIES: AI-2E family transporter [unclassified Leifsonia]SDH30009.1 Predicted PurR-regulated permease PerM [Leifsonia sp. 197AMF]SDJ06677.1 Predicted PurR-regulated permease PerM [Leifsonia sp. 466MF]SDJ65006.1 Predicted PurR-regulated permease PerM [Leifsonia sp. 157MF]SDN27406.1 Predicted PurR-regulated permease PerM [Leifsonia sp. 509MF]SEM93478.1 Predicted PurR-regulated permease PerM [Leifsonia sp. 467MF]